MPHDRSRTSSHRAPLGTDRRVIPASLAAAAMAILATGCAATAPTTPTAAVVPDKPALVQFGTCAKPEYPAGDLQASHTGTVGMQFHVREDGSVGASRIATSSGYATLDAAALTAIARCRFTPASKDGRAIPVWQDVKYVWTLG